MQAGQEIKGDNIPRIKYGWSEVFLKRQNRFITVSFDLREKICSGRNIFTNSIGSGASVHIAILSDTHGLLRREVVTELQDCTHIIHAGDIVKETDLNELRLYGSVYAVRGNNDFWQEGLRDLAHVLRFQIAGVCFLMTHDL